MTIDAYSPSPVTVVLAKEVRGVAAILAEGRRLSWHVTELGLYNLVATGGCYAIARRGLRTGTAMPSRQARSNQGANDPSGVCIPHGFLMAGPWGTGDSTFLPGISHMSSPGTAAGLLGYQYDTFLQRRQSPFVRCPPRFAPRLTRQQCYRYASSTWRSPLLLSKSAPATNVLHTRPLWAGVFFPEGERGWVQGHFPMLLGGPDCNRLYIAPQGLPRESIPAARRPHPSISLAHFRRVFSSCRLGLSRRALRSSSFSRSSRRLQVAADAAHRCLPRRVAHGRARPMRLRTVSRSAPPMTPELSTS